jgi:hypothetical protein
MQQAEVAVKIAFGPVESYGAGLRLNLFGAKCSWFTLYGTESESCPSIALQTRFEDLYRVI